LSFLSNPYKIKETSFHITNYTFSALGESIMNDKLVVTYLCNAGIMLEGNNKKVLIDSFCKTTGTPYKNSATSTVTDITHGIQPFAHIDAMLFTHSHWDHFDAAYTAGYLDQNPEAFVVATNEAATHILRLMTSQPKNLIRLDLPLHTSTIKSIDGIGIHCIAMNHGGSKDDSLQHIAYLIELHGKRILHVGDASLLKSNYKDLGLQHLGIDLLIAPFPYVGSIPGRRVIQLYIKPKKIAVVHLPYKDLDRAGWIASTNLSFQKREADFPETIFFNEPFEFFEL
jgi:L-ascorbate metabolism protein UlaG (beta-lactamase superfamily)